MSAYETFDHSGRIYKLLLFDLYFIHTTPVHNFDLDRSQNIPVYRVIYILQNSVELLLLLNDQIAVGTTVRCWTKLSFKFSAPSP